MTRKPKARYGVLKAGDHLTVHRLVYDYKDGDPRSSIIYQADIGKRVNNIPAEDLEALRDVVAAALEDRDKLEAEGKWNAG